MSPSPESRTHRWHGGHGPCLSPWGIMVPMGGSHWWLAPRAQRTPLSPDCTLCRAVPGEGTPKSWGVTRRGLWGPWCHCLRGRSSTLVPTLTEPQEHLVLLPLQGELVNSQEGLKLLLDYVGEDVLCPEKGQ